MSDGVPEQFKDQAAFIRWQQKEFEKKAREKEQAYNADMSAFATFIDELSASQLDSLESLIEDIGANAKAYQYLGIIMGSRVYRRGLMVDGQTYEEACGLTIEDEPDLRDTDSTLGEQTEELIRLSSLAKQYGLKLDHGDVTCEKCGMAYASVDDAVETMNRKGGCLTCIHKEKWG